MKPLGVKNYGSIPHLSNSKLGPGDYFIHSGQERILTEKKRDRHDTILVFEKYDGSNVGVGMKDGRILALTRSGYEAKTSPHKQHHVFAQYVERNEDYFYQLLANGERIVGEWLYQSCGISYTISQPDPIVFFDWFNAENQRLPFIYINSTDLPKPRLLHAGDSVSVESLIPTLNEKTDLIKSDELPEGMVFRVERKDKVDFLAKWVRSDFPTGRYLNEEVFNIIL